MFSKLKAEINWIKQKDPAFRAPWQLWFGYPGRKALKAHRKAHWLYRHRFFFFANMISQWTRWRTGIEIHPGASIGKGVFIDHGMGVVIGETAIVGEDVMIYHGVTLGAGSFAHGKRHPTIEDKVILSAGCKVLGDITVGRESKIGAGAVVVKNVPEKCTVVGVPGKIIIQNDAKVTETMIDPISQEIKYLKDRVSQLEKVLYENFHE